VRKAQGLSLREVGRQADVDPAQLSRIERGIDGVSIATLARLAHVLALRDLERHLSLYDVDPSGRR